MARVYFDLHVGGELVPDLEGVEFEDLEDAKADAEAALHELVADDIESQRPLQARSITMRDEHGHTLAKIQLRGSVRMVQETETNPEGDRPPTQH